MGEEKSNSEVDMYRGYAWAIDPIDGTTNLVKQGKDYCLIVCLFYDGEPLLAYTYEFYQQKLYKAVQGQGVTINGVPLHVDKYHHLNDALISIDPKRARSELLKALISKSHGFRFISLWWHWCVANNYRGFRSKYRYGRKPVGYECAIIICERVRTNCDRHSRQRYRFKSR